MKKKRSLFCILAIYVFIPSLYAKEVNIASPDGNYQMRVYDRGGKVYYSVNYKNQPIILESSLGISSNQAGKAIESDAAADNKAVSDWHDGLLMGSFTK